MELELPYSQTSQDHPMLTQEYAIYSPPIAEFFDVICEWIDNRVPGGYVYGMSRLGKSWAIKYWMTLLIEEKYQGRVAFFHMHYRQHERPSELLFLSEILAALENIFATSGKKLDMYKRVVNHMCTRAQNLKTNYVLLMIDEAQFLHEQEYQWLCNIHNGLCLSFCFFMRYRKLSANLARLTPLSCLRASLKVRGLKINVMSFNLET